MDFVGWYGSAMVNPSSIWSNYHNHEAEGFLNSNYDFPAYPNPIHPLQTADHSSPPNLNSRGVYEMAQKVTSHLPDGERLSCEEKFRGESGPSMIMGPCAMNQPINKFSGSSSNAGTVLFPQVSSIESMDCLLSSPASTNTDKSVEEDDEISLLLSDCRTLLNFGEAGSAVSSGESEKKSTRKGNIDEVVSRSSYSKGKIIKSKRRSSQSELKPAENRCGFSLRRVSNQNSARQRKPRSEKPSSSSSNINFQQPSLMASTSMWEPDSEAIEQMKEMIYRAAAFRPVNLGAEFVEKPKRKNVRISTDPQTVAARQRRERISERIRVLQKLVPGGSKMDTASMLDEAANYLKFLRSQVKSLEGLGHTADAIDCPPTTFAFSFNPSFSMHTAFPSADPNQIHNSQT